MGVFRLIGRAIDPLFLFAADLRPGVLQRDSSIEDRLARRRIGIDAEVALPLELKARARSR
jgi:hypothetical protein